MDRVFRIVPGSATASRLTVGLSAAFVLLGFSILRMYQWVAALAVWAGAALMLYVAWSMRHVQFTLSRDSLRIQGDIFGRTIPRSELLVDKAEIISVDAGSERRPMLKTCGTSVPGYIAGWFRLKNGEKALAFVTETKNVLYIPTTRGYAILLSVAQPDELLQALRDVAH